MTNNLVAAFVQDPLVRYLFPEEDSYVERASAFFGYLFDKRVACGTIWVTDGCEGASLWSQPADLPQRVTIDEVGLRERLLGAVGVEAAERIEQYDEVIGAALPVDGDFWYLGVLGSHPSHAGRGLGDAVMRAGLDRVRGENGVAYLETSRPDNVGYYERRGWSVVDSVTFAGLPTVWILSTR